jgi:hypothetical protein
MWLFGLVRSRVTNCDPARHKQVIGVRGRDSCENGTHRITSLNKGGAPAEAAPPCFSCDRLQS